MSQILPLAIAVSLVIAWGVSARFAPGVTADVTAFVLRSPATLIHESAHAVAATVTGGFATGLRMQSPISADVRSIHFTLLSRIVTPAVGYVATPVFGLACVAAGVFIVDPEFAPLPYAVCGMIGVMCLLLSRNLLALAASLWMMALSFGLMQSMWIPAEWFGTAIVLMGVLEAIRLMVLHMRNGWDIESDATSLSWGIIHPAVHAVMWLSVAVACAFVTGFLLFL